VTLTKPFGSGIYPKTSCELNCTSKGFSCNFLDLTVSQRPQGLKVYPVTFLTNALNQSMQVLKGLECLMFIPISQWRQSWGLSIVNFTDSWGFVVVRSFLSSRWSSLIVFLEAKGYPFKVLLKRTRGLVLKEKFLFGISAFGIFRMILLWLM
jgi:hypothetical protein